MLAAMLGDRLIEDLPIRYATVAVDLVSGREVHLSSGRAVELMLRRITLQRLRERPPDLLLTPDVSTISMFAVTRVAEGVASGKAIARDHTDALIALRDWRLGDRRQDPPDVEV